MPQTEPLKIKTVGFLGGYEKVVFLFGLLIFGIIVPGAVVMIAGPEWYHFYLGLGMIVAGCIGIGGFFVKQYAFTTNTGFAESVVLQGGYLEEPISGNIWFHNYDLSFDSSVFHKTRLMDYIHDEELIIPKEFQQMLGQGIEKTPAFHFVRVKPELGFISDEIIWAIPAPLENTFVHFWKPYPIIGAYPRLSADLEFVGGDVRGYYKWVEKNRLSKIQKFLQILHLRHYSRSTEKRGRVVMTTDSNLHRGYPKIALRAKEFSLEASIHGAAVVLITDAKDRDAEIEQLLAENDSVRNQLENKISHEHHIIPTTKVAGK